MPNARWQVDSIHCRHTGTEAKGGLLSSVLPQSLITARAGWGCDGLALGLRVQLTWRDPALEGVRKCNSTVCLGSDAGNIWWIAWRTRIHYAHDGAPTEVGCQPRWKGRLSFRPHSVGQCVRHVWSSRGMIWPRETSEAPSLSPEVHNIWVTLGCLLSL